MTDLDDGNDASVFGRLFASMHGCAVTMLLLVSVNAVVANLFMFNLFLCLCAKKLSV